MVKCSKCKNEFESYEGNFHRSRAKKSGFDSCCKACKAVRDSRVGKRQREKARYVSDKLRADARMSANRQWTGIYKCSVINCSLDADQLHHVDYAKPLDVVPLCRAHHYDWHRTSKLIEEPASLALVKA